MERDTTTSNPLRIAFIVNAFPELSETFVLNQIIGLRDLDHSVKILALTPRAGLSHRNVDAYHLRESTDYFGMPAGRVLRVVKLVPHLIRHWSASKRLFDVREGYRAEWRTLKLPYSIVACEHAEVDIIHCHFGQNGNVGLALRDSGTLQGKLITSFHGLDASAYPRKWGSDVYSRLFSSGDHFTANSAFVRQKLLDLGCDPTRLTILREGLFPSAFPYRQRMIPIDGHVRFFTIARLVEKKGLAYSIKAFAEVRQALPHATYHIVGDGPLRNPLRRLIQNEGLAKCVFLLGARPQEALPELSHSMHVFVLASHTTRDGDHEGQGLALQEAQAMGMPIIATRHDGFPESMLDGRSGYLVPERDVEALAERMIYVGQHPQYWDQLGRTGSEFVRSTFDQAELCRQLVRIYRSVSRKP